MEKIVSRPKNADVGRPTRSRKLQVMVSDDEYEELEASAEREGMPVSTYVRAKALIATRTGRKE